MGLFSASAATTIGLAIANPLVVQERSGRRYGDTLSDPIWLIGGVSVALLAASIPLTLVVNQAKISSTSPSTTLTEPICPN